MNQLFGPETSPLGSADRERDKTALYTEAPVVAPDTPQLHPQKPSFPWITVGVASVGFLLFFQSLNLQLVQAASFRGRADRNSVRLIAQPAPRGLIVDTNGEVLASNDRQLALTLNPLSLPRRKADREPIYTLLLEKSGVAEAELTQAFDTALQYADPIVLRSNLSRDESLLFREWFAGTAGVELTEVPVRQYAAMPSIAHVVGYVGRPRVVDVARDASTVRSGQEGVERFYDDLLTGTPARQRAEVDAAGRVVRSLDDPSQLTSTPGKTLKLGIDTRIQNLVAAALQKELLARKERFGELPKFGATAIVMEPGTGLIRALVSLPDYDPNLFANGITGEQYAGLTENPGKPLFNRATTGTYPPGSTVKPALAALGLEAGVIAPNTTVTTPAFIELGGTRFPDWTLHGRTNTRQAIAESNNIFFYAVGGGWEGGGIRGLGIAALDAGYRKVGYGSQTGIDLPTEAAGVVPNPEWKQSVLGERWFTGDTYNASIGQGYLQTTPIQVASVTSTLANGGTRYAPRLAQATIDSETGVETVIPPVITASSVIDTQWLQVVREGMRQTVTAGSARPLNTLSVTSAGKTGTAQIRSGDLVLTHAWFTGFAPYEDPRYTITVLIEAGGDSYRSAVPVAREILAGIFQETPPAEVEVASEFQGER